MRKTESKQRRNDNKNVARRGKEKQGTTVGLRSGSVPARCLSSFDGLSVLSLHSPGGRVFIGLMSSLAETLHTECVDRERSRVLSPGDERLPKLTDAKSRVTNLVLS